VDDVLKGLLQGVHQERQARLALGGCEELQQDQHVEQRDQDQQVTLVGKTAGKIPYKLELSWDFLKVGISRL